MSNADDMAAPHHKPVRLAAWCRRNLSEATAPIFWDVVAAFLPGEHTGDIAVAKAIMSRLLTNVSIVRHLRADEIVQEIETMARKKPLTAENLAARLHGRGQQILAQRHAGETKIVVGRLLLYTAHGKRREHTVPLLLCAKCHTLTTSVWRFDYSNVGPVRLCDGCTESVLQASFPRGGDAHYGALRAFRGHK